MNFNLKIRAMLTDHHSDSAFTEIPRQIVSTERTVQGIWMWSASYPKSYALKSSTKKLFQRDISSIYRVKVKQELCLLLNAMEI